jgi:hypothetical protein
MGHENRRSFRFEVQGDAAVRWGQETNRYQLGNLSLGGALMRTMSGNTPAMGDEVQAVLHVRGARTIALHGRVVRGADRDPAGFAIAFDRLSPRAEDAIENMSLEVLQRGLRSTVLVVSGLRGPGKVLGQCMRDTGWRVITVASPLDAVQRLADPSLDVRWLVVLDHLTQTSAADLMRYASEEHPAVRRILVRGSDPLGPLGEELADVRLTLPVDRASLREVIGAGPGLAA